MTAHVWSLTALDEAAVGRVAELVALKLRRGDAVLLRGDLGAGKTTFARALIRALLGDREAEVPSPTFPVLQPYETARLKLGHFDLYRISSASELEEIGFDDALASGAALVEWPERAEEAMPDSRLEIALTQGQTADLRDVSLSATGSWVERLRRLEDIHAFLMRWHPSHISYLQGDASARAYARIVGGDRRYVLMDAPRMPDGPPILNGLPYSRIAHLAEDVRPFVAIGRALEAQGASVPHIHAADLDAGLLLLEDLGDMTFARALDAGVPQSALWGAAVDALIELRRRPLSAALPLPDGTSYELPRFDRAALEIELSLILDWYWPEMKGSPAPDGVRREFLGLWSPVLDTLLAEPPGLFLRDFHSPNLFWLPDREPVRRIGIIDFQDALAESWPLDLVSLLQDARTDVPRDLEARELDRYLATVGGFEPTFDAEQFRTVYAAFGAQRNTRLVGLWVRLLRRDGKPGYLRHMPRTWDYLERNLAHPTLAALKAWYDEHFPSDLRRRAIEA
ncbi:MAG: tRNA (adenosine(37)-N6)-threonylcarbamoyltransferase complex ATPase subunit type 1 TsaE [Proteobacteria bacterium]|nr:tRNA (adenosine(37)-N6)-threonylcarbamoyltransferase complex ATPase subunit type 1 TsaE [Pseudomonadota bacterium]